ncbi:protein elicitor protein [Zalerion maritima]|uniref:Protein elicitor protein n=1 Tax=Zalerion maritima TaxID=339359 RepID=A0AAD5RKW0_9PEZI|nr:protein elicitor protein [Zalerion maritima]
MKFLLALSLSCTTALAAWETISIRNFVSVSTPGSKGNIDGDVLYTWFQLDSAHEDADGGVTCEGATYADTYNDIFSCGKYRFAFREDGNTTRKALHLWHETSTAWGCLGQGDMLCDSGVGDERICKQARKYTNIGCDFET